MTDKKSDAERDERMHDSFMAMGLGLRKLNKALDGELSEAEVRTACSNHLTAQPEIKKFLEARGLSEFCELDEEGRRELSAHLKKEQEQLFRERGWDFSDETPVLH